MLAYPDPYLLEPSAIAESYAQYGPTEDEEVFAAVAGNFGLFAALLQDVSYAGNSIYPVVNRADNLNDAIAYLSAGFEPELAATIANYYFGWDEELYKLVLIPTDSIPIITTSDRDKTKITFINDHRAVLQRIYENCYAEQDRYLYTIYVQKEAAGWKICDLSLEEIK